MIGTSGSRVLDFVGRIILSPFIILDHVWHRLRARKPLSPADYNQFHEWGMSSEYEEAYLVADFKLRHGWKDIVDEFNLLGWKSPWVNNHYRDGNPMFSVATPFERAHVIVLMHPIGSVGASGDADGIDMSRMTIYSGITDRDIAEVLALLRMWVRHQKQQQQDVNGT